MSIKEIVKNNKVEFNYYRQGNMYYNVLYRGDTYIFPVPLSDVQDASLHKTEKAIIFMRYIRKAIEDNTFQPITK